MGRYFLDVCLNSNIAIDREGEDYANLELAEQAARLQLVELLREFTNIKKTTASIIIREFDAAILSSVSVILTTLWTVER